MTVPPIAVIRERLLARAATGRMVSFKTDFYALPLVVQDALYGIAADLEDAAAELERVTAERDEARAWRDRLREALRGIKLASLLRVRQAAFAPAIGVRYTEAIRAEIASACFGVEAACDAALAGGTDAAPPEQTK